MPALRPSPLLRWSLGVLSLLSVLPCAPASAQPSSTYLPRVLGVPSQLVSQRWSKDEGLPQNSVTAALQTRRGPVWLGTQEGLVRFDGVRFRTYRREQHRGLVSNDITSLYEDARGMLWIGTQAGISRFDGTAFRPFASQGLPHQAIRALEEDSQGNLWIGTLGGVARYDGHMLSSSNLSDLPDMRVIALSRDAEGRMWVGTLGGLVVFEDGRFRRVPLPGALAHAEVRALHLDPRNQLWVGTSAGLARRRGNGTFELFDRARGADACASIQALATDAQGVLWLGTEARGVCAYMGGQFLAYEEDPSLAGGRVTALAEDQEGGLLIGLASGGLRRLHRGPFVTIGENQGLPSSVVLSVLESRDGSIWIGTDGGGLAQYGGDGQVRRIGQAEGLPSATVMALAQRRDGSVWAGAAGGGACRLEGGRFRCLTERDGLRSDHVFSMLETRDGAFWIGTETGLNRLVGTTVEDLSGLHPALSQTYVTSLLETPRGDVWVATYGAGLVRIRNGRATAFGPKEGLKNADALTLLSDTEGGLWAGFDGGGLCRFQAQQDRFRCYDAEDGLFDNRVLQLLEDRDGYFWLGSNQGYVRVRRTDLDAYDAGRLRRIPYQVMGVSKYDGLRDAEANGGLQPSAFRTRSGSLLFATVGGLAVMDPARLRLARKASASPVYFDHLEVAGKQFDFPLPRTVRLLPTQRDLRFRVGVVTLSLPDRVRIRYRLIGYRNSEWRTQEGLDREMIFANLAPGSYQLEVQATDGDGGWGRGATLPIHIQAYYYETWWFMLMVVLAAGLLVVTVFRLRVRALKRRQVELESLVAHRTSELRVREQELKVLNTQLEEVNAGLEEEVQRQVEVRIEEQRVYERELVAARDKAEESARLKQSILNNMSHEIRTPIGGILGFAEILAYEAPAELQEFVTHISVCGKRLLSTLDAVFELSQLESGNLELHMAPADVVAIVERATAVVSPLAKERGLTVRTEVPKQLITVVDGFGLERVLACLLSNAIKFTEQGEVGVHLTSGEDGYELRVTDTGRGISPAFLPHLFEPFKQESEGLSRSYEGSGLGLAVAYRFVTALGGTLEAESAPGCGSTFTARFPWVLPSGDGDGRLVEAPRAHLLSTV